MTHRLKFLSWRPIAFAQMADDEATPAPILSRDQIRDTLGDAGNSLGDILAILESIPNCALRKDCGATKHFLTLNFVPPALHNVPIEVLIQLLEVHVREKDPVGLRRAALLLRSRLDGNGAYSHDPLLSERAPGERISPGVVRPGALSPTLLYYAAARDEPQMAYESLRSLWLLAEFYPGFPQMAYEASMARMIRASDENRTRRRAVKTMTLIMIEPLYVLDRRNLAADIPVVSRVLDAPNCDDRTAAAICGCLKQLHAVAFPQSPLLPFASIRNLHSQEQMDSSYELLLRCFGQARSLLEQQGVLEALVSLPFAPSSLPIHLDSFLKAVKAPIKSAPGLGGEIAPLESLSAAAVACSVPTWPTQVHMLTDDLKEQVREIYHTSSCVKFLNTQVRSHIVSLLQRLLPLSTGVDDNRSSSFLESTIAYFHSIPNCEDHGLAEKL